MTSLELSQRLLRRWRIRDLGNTPASVLLEMLDAINAGFQDFYAAAPSIYREIPISGVLAAPQVAQLTCTKGGKAFTGFTGTPDNYFATTRISTDTEDNLLIPPSGLIDTFQGQTGTWPATIYGDTIPLPTNVESLLDEPALMGSSYRLVRNDEYWMHPWNRMNFTGGRGLWPYNGGGATRAVGKPRSYWIEPNAIAVDGSPSLVLRVDPIPDVLYRLRMRALVYPTKLKLSDLQQAVTLPINDAWVESKLIPLILPYMTESELWRDRSGIQTILKKADSARAEVERLRADACKVDSNSGTPEGF